MTHDTLLDDLERDVARARVRLSGNLARLRDPRMISHAKADLMAQADDYRHRLVESVGGAANARAQNLGDLLRQRAQENPAALAAIGAGVLWRLWKRPPVATLLVGAGLASLLAGRGEEGGAPAEGLLGRVQEVNRVTHALGGAASQNDANHGRARGIVGRGLMVDHSGGWIADSGHLKARAAGRKVYPNLPAERSPGSAAKIRGVAYGRVCLGPGRATF